MRSKIAESLKRRRKKPTASPLPVKQETTSRMLKELGKPPRGVTIRVPPSPARNGLCPCGSGQKYKLCHGAPLDQPYRTMQYRDIRSLYTAEQREAAQQFVYRWGFEPDPTQLRVFMTDTEDAVIEMITKLARKRGMQEDLIKGIQAAKRMLSPRNRGMWSEQELKDYVRAFESVGVILASSSKDAGA